VLDLVTAGETFDDFVFHGLARLPKPGEEIKTDSFARSPGGGAIITAVAAARLGLRCGVIASLSREAARLLRAEGIRVINVRRPEEPSAISIAMSTTTDRAFVTFNGMHATLPGRLRAALPRVRARHVHLALFPGACRPWIATIRSLARRGVGVSWDFGWNPQLCADRSFAPLARTVDDLFLNRDEAIVYAGVATLVDALAHWRRSPNRVIVKLGARGACVVGGEGREIRRAAPRVRVLDTTGAGDAFNGGFLAATLRGAGVADAVTLGNRIGALSTRRPGGLAGLPHTGTA
jgi:sugar/nucleoside kinase (ribokinase family)